MYGTGSGSGGFFRKLLFWGAVVIGVPVLAVGMASLLRPAPTPVAREPEEPAPAPPPSPEPEKKEEPAEAKSEAAPEKKKEPAEAKAEAAPEKKKEPAEAKAEAAPEKKKEPAKAEAAPEKKPAGKESDADEIAVKLKPDKGAQVEGVLVDLSLDGATVRTEAELKKGTIVQLVLPSKKRGKGLSLAGSITANSGGRLEMKFASLNKGLRTRLEKFLESQSS